MVDPEHDDRADNSNYHAVEVETGDAADTKYGKQEAAHDRANDAKYDVEDGALAGAVDDAVRDKASDKAEDDPR